MNRNPTYAFSALDEALERGGLKRFDLANWGIEDVAYVKPLDISAEGGEGGYGIFAADGTELAQMENRDEAIVTIRQNDLEALSVH